MQEGMLGKYLSDQKNSMEAKETIGNGYGRKFTKSQFSDQNRQDVSAVQNSAERPEVRAMTVWRLNYTVTSTVQAAKG